MENHVIVLEDIFEDGHYYIFLVVFLFEVLVPGQDQEFPCCRRRVVALSRCRVVTLSRCRHQDVPENQKFKRNSS